MTVAYYLSPWQALFRNPPGRFTETDVAGLGLATNGPRVLLYADWRRDVTGNRCTTLKMRPVATPHVCLCRVDATDAVLADVDADSAITRIPFGPSDLGRTFGSLSALNQSRLITALDNRRIDTSWIVADTTLRQIVGHVIRYFLAYHRLGGAFPDLNLSGTVGDLTPGQRNAARNFITSLGGDISDITNQTSLRVVARRLGQLDWPGGVRFAGEVF